MPASVCQVIDLAGPAGRRVMWIFLNLEENGGEMREMKLRITISRCTAHSLSSKSVDIFSQWILLRRFLLCGRPPTYLSALARQVQGYSLS